MSRGGTASPALTTPPPFLVVPGGKISRSADFFWRRFCVVAELAKEIGAVKVERQCLERGSRATGGKELGSVLESCITRELYYIPRETTRMYVSRLSFRPRVCEVYLDWRSWLHRLASVASVASSCGSVNK